MDSKPISVIMGLSGGMDSTTLLALLLDDGYDVSTVTFQYPSKHNPYERMEARSVASSYGVSNVTVDLRPAFEGVKSALVTQDIAVPEGHYEDPQMAATVVPGRNTIFLSVLASMAESRGLDAVAFGAHEGDAAIYPDCRLEYVSAMRKTIRLSTEGKVGIIAPFLKRKWSKIDMIEWGVPNNVPYHQTRTCYKPQALSCGKCGACQERKEAFELNGYTDPLPYEN